jgi:hypothetical protein
MEMVFYTAANKVYAPFTENQSLDHLVLAE